MAHPRRLSRRQFLQLTIGSCSTAAAAIAYSVYGEPAMLELRHTDVAVADLDPRLAGLTIALLADLHLSPEVSQEHVARAIELAQSARPDLVLLGGDFVSRGSGYVTAVLDAVALLSAPLGVFAVLGNRDHSSDVVEPLSSGLRERGITLLRNQSIQLDRGGAALHLIGVDDLLAGQADPERAFANVPPGGLRLLLVHEPDFADQAASYGVQLQLSGHSHGGQVRLPLAGALLLPPLGRRYPIGLQRVAGSSTQVYTSRGVGLIPPAVRINCRPEVAILRLVRPEQ